MSFVPRTIMIIEDDQNIVELLRLYLVNQGYRVIISPNRGERGGSGQA